MDDKNIADLVDRVRDFNSIIWEWSENEIGRYVITGMQVGNERGELGWLKYIGYVVQVRKMNGAFGSDLVFLRHPDGSLMTHENQTLHRVADKFLDEIKSVFGDGVDPSIEDYSKEYSIGGRFPAVGKIIEHDDEMPVRNVGPLMKITIEHGDGSKTIEVI